MTVSMRLDFWAFVTRRHVHVMENTVEGHDFGGFAFEFMGILNDDEGIDYDVLTETGLKQCKRWRFEDGRLCWPEVSILYSLCAMVGIEEMERTFAAAERARQESVEPTVLLLQRSWRCVMEKRKQVETDRAAKRVQCWWRKKKASFTRFCNRCR